jgi:hypothetical protein
MDSPCVASGCRRSRGSPCHNQVVESIRNCVETQGSRAAKSADYADPESQSIASILAPWPFSPALDGASRDSDDPAGRRQASTGALRLHDRREHYFSFCPSVSSSSCWKWLSIRLRQRLLLTSQLALELADSIGRSTGSLPILFQCDPPTLELSESYPGTLQERSQ